MPMQRLIADLTYLRRRIRALLITQAAISLLTIAGGFFLVIGLLDYFVHFPGYARLIWMSFFAVWCAKYIHKRIILPATTPISLDQLALGLPSVSSDDRDQLASSLAFAQQGGAGSQELWRRVVENSAGSLNRDRLVETISWRGAVRNFGIAFCIALGLLIARVLSADLFNIGAARLTTPWKDVRWPRAVEIEALSGDATVARGESFKAQMRLARGN